MSTVTRSDQPEYVRFQRRGWRGLSMWAAAALGGVGLSVRSAETRPLWATLCVLAAMVIMMVRMGTGAEAYRRRLRREVNEDEGLAYYRESGWRLPATLALFGAGCVTWIPAATVGARNGGLFFILLVLFLLWMLVISPILYLRSLPRWDHRSLRV